MGHFVTSWFVSFETFKMYSVMWAFAPSLHRESTDSQLVSFSATRHAVLFCFIFSLYTHKDTTSCNIYMQYLLLTYIILTHTYTHAYIQPDSDVVVGAVDESGFFITDRYPNIYTTASIHISQCL